MEIGKFVKQYKGKDLGKVPKSKLENNYWYVGIKYDGNYMQIHKKCNEIWFFTSSGEQMIIKELAEELKGIGFDFIVEAEFNNNSSGLSLNDRRFSSTGTARADFKKGIITSYPQSRLNVFDILKKDGSDLREHPFVHRMNYLDYFNTVRIKGVDFKLYNTLEEAIGFAKGVMAQGGEGAFAFHEFHTIKEKGRSNLAIKIKANNKKTMLCVGADLSETVDNEWGSLRLRDENGLVQSFGGLTDKLRKMHPYAPTGEFEVRYESFTNGKYIQGFINEK